MAKTILITGSTDGIGLETAKMLAADGHLVLMHGRNAAKLEAAQKEVGAANGFVADLSLMADVHRLAEEVRAAYPKLDVLMNNAGVLKTPKTTTPEGFDVRFVVNTLAPYVLTRALLPSIPADGRIINLSSAAQAPVNATALLGDIQVDDMEAYAQSKLAITMWSREMAKELADGPLVLAVNPGSLLASKMVKEGFGIAGKDIRTGAALLCRTAVDDAFAAASGKYFDNDAGKFADPHQDALDPVKSRALIEAIEAALAQYSSS